MENVQIRHVEFSDYPALQQLFAHPQVYRDTLQLPYPRLKCGLKRSKKYPLGCII